MRDGARLATTLYLPAGAGRYAGILIRTPYGRPLEDLQARFFCRHGFAVAVQHVRGRFNSGGEWHPFVHEGKDGYDTIEWLAKQPWCTGRIGMTGGSYSGWVQWWAAAERPPHLVTIVPGASPSDPFDGGIPYEGGVFCTTTSLGFLDVTARNATVDVSGAAMLAVASRNWSKAVRSLPVIDLDKKVLGRRDRIWRTWIRHFSKDGYWRQVSFLDSLRTMSIPVFHNAGAFDALTTATILNYRRMRTHGHGHQKLVVGPWPHFGETRSVWRPRLRRRCRARPVAGDGPMVRLLAEGTGQRHRRRAAGRGVRHREQSLATRLAVSDARDIGAEVVPCEPDRAGTATGQAS